MTTHDRHDRPDPDPLESRLRAHLRAEADSVRVPHDVAAPSTLRRAANERIATRHHRRVAAVSLSGVAAAALVVGLVVNAQAPQPVRTTDAAGPSPVAGVATGSSTGSATGAMKGWRATEGEAARRELAALRVTLPGTGDEALTGIWTTGTERGAGRPAADLAVLADLAPGEPVRFVVASVQSSDHLTMGRGGRELTIHGRPARLIVGNHGWHRLIWAMDEDTHVLTQAYGLSLEELEEVLATLRPEGDGWAMDPAGTGLEPVGTTPPESQVQLTLDWAEDAAGVRASHTSLTLTDAGPYEFWASLVGYTPSHAAELRAIEVGLGDGTTATAVLSGSGPSPTGESWARLVVLDPSGTVVTVDRWQEGDDAGSTSASEVFEEAAPQLFVRLDDDAWADLLRAAVRAAEEPAADERAAREQAAEDGAVRGESWAPGPDGAATTAPPRDLARP